MVRPLDENQGTSSLQGRGSWLMCEVALRARNTKNLIHLLSWVVIIPMCGGGASTQRRFLNRRSIE
jgi:hypothetical protein